MKKRAVEKEEKKMGLQMLEVGSPCTQMAYVLDCKIVVCEFELQSHDYVPFQTIILGKGMNSVIPLQLRVKYHDYCPLTRIALTLNNSRRLICH